MDVAHWPKWRSTHYVECIPESPEESIARDAMRTQRAIFVRWQDRFQAVRDFVGWPELKPGPPPWISRVTPHRHPECQAMLCVGCSRIQPWRPIGKTEADPILGQVAKYELAKLYLNYEATLYDVREDKDCIGTNGKPCDVPAGATIFTMRNVVPLFVPGGKNVTTPRGLLKWAEGTAGASGVLGKPVALESSRFVAEGELTLNWIDTPVYPIQSILNLTNKVNNDTFLGFPAGTLLLAPPRQRPTTSPAPTPTGGLRTQDVTFTLRWLPNVNKAGTAKGHNALLTFDNGSLDYFYPTSDGTLAGDKIHGSGDFNRLFRPDP